jgi:hypothetical protein
MPTRQPRTSTTTPTQRRASELCARCHREPRANGSSYCDTPECKSERSATWRKYNDKRIRKTTHQPRLTPEERERNHRETVKRTNEKQRVMYLAAPVCPRCCESISVERDCKCSRILGTTTTPQYRDVVRVLDVVTMRVKVEVR